MISSLDTSMPTGMPPRPEGQSLTDSQKETVSSILSSFDAENLSSDDASAIVEQLKEAGIEPSKSLSSVLASSGFDSKNIAELSGQGKPPPPPRGSASSLPDTATFSVTA